MLIKIIVIFLVSFAIHAAEFGNITVSEVTSIYAPELKGKYESEKLAARKAKHHAVNLLRSGKVIELRGLKRGKYFRILADVYIDGKSLAENLTPQRRLWGG